MIGLSIDTGVENGVCLFTFGSVRPFEVSQLWQFGGGAQGLKDWMEREACYAGDTSAGAPILLGSNVIDALVVEKFTPRPQESFAQTQKSIESLRVEGVLIGRDFGQHINWAQPAAQYFMGASSLPLAQKKMLSREFLKLHDIYPTGKTVGRKNADDAISATLHAIAYLRRKRHMPTLRAMFPETRKEES